VRRRVGYRWHLRRLMAERDLYQTTELVPLLAERGVRLSREQVYRLATGVPRRLNLEVLAALCDILDCGPGDLIDCYRETGTRKPDAPSAPTGELPRPRRARIAHDDETEA
jgi:DNA-binding Xre family transcriptional regulator